MKQLIRSVLWALHLDITRNLKYDRLTWKVMRKVLKPNSNCIDVGCHKGELLDWMLKLSPQGKHYAFEPIPDLNKNLHEKYDTKDVQIFGYALSDEEGKTEFQLVKNAPAYSGIKKRTYAVAEPDIEAIEVVMKRLDKVIPAEVAISLIKVDVEGAEYHVLKGAETLILTHKPTILFEFGLGAADHYDVHPQEMFDLLEHYKLNIYTLKSYLNNGDALSANELSTHFRENSEYYFVASPKTNA